jgi:3-oxoadipate enol-lactonase
MNDTPRIRLSEGDVAGPALVCLPGAMCSPQVFADAARHSGLAAFGLAWLEDDGPHDPEAFAAVLRAIACMEHA